MNDRPRMERYRIRHIPTGAWWEGPAISVQEAIILAKKENLIFVSGGLDIKMKTYVGAGGWKKVKPC